MQNEIEEIVVLTYLIFGTFTDMKAQQRFYRLIRSFPDHCIHGDLMFVRHDDTAESLMKKLTISLALGNKVFAVRVTDWAAWNQVAVRRWLESPPVHVPGSGGGVDDRSGREGDLRETGEKRVRRG